LTGYNFLPYYFDVVAVFRSERGLTGMKRLAIVLGILLPLLLVFSSTAALAAPPERVDVIIGCDRTLGTTEQALLRGFGGDIKFPYQIIPAIAASISEDAIAGLSINPEVTIIQTDVEVHAVDDTVPNTPYSWGYNFYGQLGDSSTTNRNTPVQVSDLTDVTTVAGGTAHSLALKSDGTVWAWGRNSFGQLGDGTTTNRNIPVQVSDLTDITAVAGGSAHSLALKSDGTVWAWGYNSYGQLGDGTTIDNSTPVQVSGLTDVITVSGGADHSLALKSDGTVWAWGYNYYGQLGDGTTTDNSTPVQVSGLTDVTTVAGGSTHSLALKSDGTVWTWGYNYYGQLGDGTTTDNSTPVQVSSLTDITAVAGGYNHSLALKSDGTVWVWGRNNYGQLGDGTTIKRYTPVQVSGLTDVIAVSGGYHHNLALKSDGTVWAWGWNVFGQLGDGTTINRYTPVQVSGLTGFTAVAGGYHSLAITGQPGNNPPVANDDAYSTGRHSVLNVDAPGVLSNDSDPDGNPLTVELVKIPSNGTAAVNADGSFTYRPKPNYCGMDSFTYKASDGITTSSEATVMIAVNVPAGAVLTIDSPLSGVTVDGTVIVQADVNVEMDYVEFLIDGKFAGRDRASPYEYSWNSLKELDGWHTLTAQGKDLASLTVVSDPVMVNVLNGSDTLEVAVSAPGDGSTVTLPTTITATVIGEASLVEILIDGKVKERLTIAPYEYVWTRLQGSQTVGWHTITARACSLDKQKMISMPIRVYVSR
jgi:alpha-tubulin suppressor-like RCC1 family protein